MKLKSGDKVLVTGSSGFVGRALTARLKELGFEVIEFSRRLGCDMTQLSAFDRFGPVTAVIHLAAQMSVTGAFADPLSTYQTNIVGTLNALEYCRKNGTKKFLYLSSYVYGPPQSLPVSENHPLNIGNPYGRSKKIGESLCLGYFEDFGVVPLVLRPFNVYGPGQSEDFLIPRIVKQVIDPKNTEITLKDLEPKRDFLFIQDLIRAIEGLLLEDPFAEPEIFNVGSGESHSVADIVAIVQELAGTNKKIVSAGERRKNEVMDCIADISKIKRHLDWIPRTTLREGLRLTIEASRA